MRFFFKKTEWDGAGLTGPQSCQLNSPTCPPTSGPALMWFVFTLNAKHPERKLAPKVRLQLCINTQEWHLSSFRHLQEQSWAKKAFITSKQKQWKWLNCVWVCVCKCVAYYLWAVDDTFKLMLIFKWMFFYLWFCRKPLKNLYSVCPWDVYIERRHEITCAFASAPPAFASAPSLWSPSLLSSSRVHI